MGLLLFPPLLPKYVSVQYVWIEEEEEEEEREQGEKEDLCSRMA